MTEQPRASQHSLTKREALTALRVHRPAWVIGGVVTPILIGSRLAPVIGGPASSAATIIGIAFIDLVLSCSQPWATSPEVVKGRRSHA